MDFTPETYLKERNIIENLSVYLDGVETDYYYNWTRKPDFAISNSRVSRKLVATIERTKNSCTLSSS